ncbi:MAG: hypothetical protein ACE5IT_06430 [bacterium]
MRKILLISLALALVIGLAMTVILDAHTRGYYGDEDIKADIKKIDKGIQITITSEDPETAKDIQENARWYRDIFRSGGHHDSLPYGGGRYGYHHGCGGWYW